MSGKEAYKLIITALSGLLHLHTRIDTGVKYSNKPSIAHRDIKSKNILVTENLACVVVDFGMAVTQNQNLKTRLNKLFKIKYVKIIFVGVFLERCRKTLLETVRIYNSLNVTV